MREILAAPSLVLAQQLARAAAPGAGGGGGGRARGGPREARDGEGVGAPSPPISSSGPAPGAGGPASGPRRAGPSESTDGPALGCSSARPASRSADGPSPSSSSTEAGVLQTPEAGVSDREALLMSDQGAGESRGWVADLPSLVAAVALVRIPP